MIMSILNQLSADSTLFRYHNVVNLETLHSNMEALSIENRKFFNMQLDSLPVYTYEVNIYMFRNRCKLIFTLSVCQGKLNDNDEKSIIIRQQHDKTVNMCR